MKTRGERRLETERIKKKFASKQKHQKLWADGDKSAGVYANHGKPCSCWMCRNPRRNGEITIQELRADMI